MVPLTEIGLWTPEYARKRWKGKHPALPYNIVLALLDLSKEAGLTFEEYWKRTLKEHGVDPDKPYEPPDE